MSAPDVDQVVSFVRARQNPTPLDKAQTKAYRAAKRAEKKAATARLRAWKRATKAGEEVRDELGHLRDVATDEAKALRKQARKELRQLRKQARQAYRSLPDGLTDALPTQKQLRSGLGAVEDALPSRHDLHHAYDRTVGSAANVVGSGLQAAGEQVASAASTVADRLPSAHDLRVGFTGTLAPVTDRLPELHRQGLRVTVQKKPTRREKLAAAAAPLAKAAPVVLVAAAVAFVVVKTVKTYSPGFLADVKEGAAEREAELRTELGLDVWSEDPNLPDDYVNAGKDPKTHKRV